MSFSLAYLIIRFFYNMFGFLNHWYLSSFRIVSRGMVNTLEWFDRHLAFRVTLAYFFKPLYQDYSFAGYLFGFIFRSVRIIFALILYPAIIVIFLSVYVLWAIIPIYIIYAGFFK